MYNSGLVGIHYALIVTDCVFTLHLVVIKDYAALLLCGLICVTRLAQALEDVQVERLLSYL